ncbi:hypothetical protein Taro_049150 [Colocasia esculenta]|uniref:Uncharacterized protein n=1 Tax=Colocasia esculenta TaxID=4460 RepID=A0A843XA36_COLES|nr:hypothetical protein [Colocasia esculenta]
MEKTTTSQRSSAPTDVLPSTRVLTLTSRQSELDYGPTPDLSKWFRGRQERGSEKQDWLACAG